jgi:hypothetical protein
MEYSNRWVKLFICAIKSGMTRIFFSSSESIIVVNLENESFVVIDTWSQRIIQNYEELHNKSITTMPFYLSDSFLC